MSKSPHDLMEGITKEFKQVLTFAVLVMVTGLLLFFLVAGIKYYTWGKKDLYSEGKCSIEYVFSRLDVEQQDDFIYSNEKLLANALTRTNKRCVFYIMMSEELVLPLSIVGCALFYYGIALLVSVRKLKKQIGVSLHRQGP